MNYCTLIGRASDALLLAALMVLAGGEATGQDKSAAKPSVISLPSGPGSIEGLGKSFQPHLNSGSFSYEIPIVLPRGAGGFAPPLALSYDSRYGNSVVGQGWRISGPLSIERQTEKGFPRYRDSEAAATASSPAQPADIFLFEGEELVPLSDGAYRLRNEFMFRRFRRRASVEGQAIDSWIAEDKNGVK